jgi:arylsulfatase A-like enzyme
MRERIRPNIVLIVADDHAPAAIGSYGSRINRTPNLDRLAAEGARLDNCFCTNALCTPARATILTGQYSHRTGVRTLEERLDQTQHATLAMLLHAQGYQTAMIGKWHLGHGGPHDPAGFDYWSVLPNQGSYFDPELIEPDARRVYPGYVTDVLTDLALGWLASCDPARPFFLMCGHKAPHDPFVPHPRDRMLYTEPIREPATFDDDYVGRAAAAATTQRVAWMHRKDHLPDPSPPGLDDEARRHWNYQCFMQNYLRCVAAIDDNVGRLLRYLDETGLSQDTIVIYTADHGFFLGEHGWYDKRFMYEPSIRIPFLMRYPRAVKAGTVVDKMVINTDFAPTLLDYAGQAVPVEMQGRSLRPLLEGSPPSDWRTAFYYHYWMHLAHFNVPAHYGIRTDRYKLIYYQADPPIAAGVIQEQRIPAWEFFDLHEDPDEMHNLYDAPEYAPEIADLQHQLVALRQALGDQA